MLSVDTVHKLARTVPTVGEHVETLAMVHQQPLIADCCVVRNRGKHVFDGDESANRQCSLLKCRWLSLVGQLETLALEHVSAFIYLCVCVSLILGAGSLVSLFSQVCVCVCVCGCACICVLSRFFAIPKNLHIT